MINFLLIFSIVFISTCTANIEIQLQSGDGMMSEDLESKQSLDAKLK